MQETPVQFLGWEDTLEKGEATNSSFLSFPSGSDGKESTRRAGDLNLIPGLGIPWRRAWHSSPVLLPGEFPWTEAAGLQSMGLQRVGHNWATNTYTFFHSTIEEILYQWYWVFHFYLTLLNSFHCSPEICYLSLGAYLSTTCFRILMYL